MIARPSGGEFVILLDSTDDAQDVIDIASHIIASISEPTPLRVKTVRVDAAIGIAMFPANGSTDAQLMRRTDSAVYSAKSAGKNSCCFSPPALADR